MGAIHWLPACVYSIVDLDAYRHMFFFDVRQGSIVVEHVQAHAIPSHACFGTTCLANPETRVAHMQGDIVMGIHCYIRQHHGSDNGKMWQ